MLDGSIEPIEYQAAFPAESGFTGSKFLRCMGMGVIYSANGIPYNSKKRFCFYTTNRKIK